ncbi:Glutamate carboxypeptidase tre2 [Lasiodiplodia theobromae]|uniref:Uncharacterized protein n=1 Tax=Lasiodiplodia theobromae TaxID=45133 RepID=A0A5N5D856_9PEZI|nr:Glutamate carboxypeptidase tre2 [Lasiodiplodia theobromae]KAB2573889.1 hypothetical protein DBV05_g7436 [Lasiodiplodia theobromae]KAF4541282.1 Glutamate carboxypeptidase tre2 [Lasiodiplodia theobromae]
MTTTNNPAPTTSTLYPKILSDIRPFLRYLSKHGAPAPLHMTGTVKLHGTHADMRIDLSIGPDNATVTPQSRNNTTLTRGARDNYEFAAFCAAQHAAIVRLAERACARWRELHPASDDSPMNEDVILAGEWIGSGVQKKPHTAIRDLSPRLFVLCGVRIRGVWEHIERYADVADEGARLYNISRGGFFRLPFALDEVGDGAAPAAAAAATFLAEARRLTAEVYARCPFGAALGVEGPGEGIVWNPSPDQGVPNVPDLWLKTKGEDFDERSKKGPKENAVAKDGDKKKAVEAFVGRTCHERRLEQGWDYLREMGVERNTKGIQTFLSWVTRDIEVEEKEEIVELNLGTDWKIAVTRMARTWYLAQLEKGGRDNAAD